MSHGREGSKKAKKVSGIFLMIPLRKCSIKVSLIPDDNIRRYGYGNEEPFTFQLQSILLQKL
jgi:hypothetical protein